MIRARVRKDGTPAYSFVMRVITAYEHSRRDFTNPHYKALSSGSDPTLHRNWKHYVRCSKAVADLNVTPEEYMQTLFVEASNLSYPKPSNLYSKTSVSKVKSRSTENREVVLIEINEQWLRRAESNSHLGPEILVLFPWVNYSDWFRVYHGKVDGINKRYAKSTQEKLTDDFKASLIEKGYDLTKLTDKINRILNDR